jgi:hypothetical protein
MQHPVYDHNYSNAANLSSNLKLRKNSEEESF